MNEGAVRLALIGLAAGLLSGLFGIGGGIVMVPFLVFACGFEQHRAHVNSLGAGIAFAFAGALTFALEDSVDLGAAALLAAGSIAGAQLGARVMARASEGGLKTAFGALLVVVSLVLVIQ